MVAFGKPLCSDALFWIASMSRPLTDSAFMMLVDGGKVIIEDPVAKYLPEFADLMVEVDQGGFIQAALAACAR